MNTKDACDDRQSESDSQSEPSGGSHGCADDDHFLVQEISRRQDALGRYDRRIANAESRPGLQTCWRDFKAQEMQSVARLTALMRERDPAGLLLMCDDRTAQ